MRVYAQSCGSVWSVLWFVVPADGSKNFVCKYWFRMLIPVQCIPDRTEISLCVQIIWCMHFLDRKNNTTDTHS